MANYLAARRDQIARRVRQLLTLLRQICVEELLVIAARNKTDLLRVRLVGKYLQALVARLFADFWLTHVTQREQRSRKLLLRQSKKKVRLVLRMVHRTLQQPPATLLIEFVARVMPGRDVLGTDLACRSQQLIKLQMIVAERARNRRSARKIVVDEWLHDVALKPVFLVHHV